MSSQNGEAKASSTDQKNGKNPMSNIEFSAFLPGDNQTPTNVVAGFKVGCQSLTLATVGGLCKYLQWYSVN